MPTSTEQINEMIEANAALSGMWHTQSERWDDEVVAAQSAYAALAGNLKNVVTSMMTFSGTVDPDDPAPTNVDAGTFNTIADLIEMSPRGSHVTVTLKAAKEYPIAVLANVHNRSLYFIKDGVGANPVIKPVAYVSTTNENYLYGFSAVGGGSMLFRDVDIELTGPKSDVGLPWNVSRKALVTPREGLPIQIGLVNGVVTGSDNARILNGSPACTSIINLSSMTLDGAMFAVGSVSVAMINTNAVTLSNGAALADGGAIGTNILQN